MRPIVDVPTPRQQKRCTKCLTLKPHMAFSKHGDSPDGLRTICRLCFNARQKARRGRRAPSALPRVALDPDIRRYREEKEKALPRLARRAKEKDRIIHAMVERMAVSTTYGFYITPRDLSA